MDFFSIKTSDKRIINYEVVYTKESKQRFSCVLLTQPNCISWSIMSAGKIGYHLIKMIPQGFLNAVLEC